MESHDAEFATVTTGPDGRPRPVAVVDLLAGMDPSEYPPVKFGKRDDDEMPHTWAVRALTWLHEHQPETFGNMMLATMNVPAHVTKNRGGK